jgi:hypothetical protein
LLISIYKTKKQKQKQYLGASQALSAAAAAVSVVIGRVVVILDVGTCQGVVVAIWVVVGLKVGVEGGSGCLECNPTSRLQWWYVVVIKQHLKMAMVC